VAWEAGLDLLAATGLRAAVIPHYDNAEGGNHDTRFCYLGERRLARLEAQMPDDSFVLGVDEHTACILDLDAGTAVVTGNGVVTARRDGRSVTFPAGTTVAIDALGRFPTAATASASRTVDPRAGVAEADRPAAAVDTGLLVAAERLEGIFTAAIAARDVDTAVGAVLELDAAIVEWSRDTLQSDEADRARVVLRRCVVGLGDLARRGAADPRDAIAPFVDALLDARARARDDRDFARADEIRDRLLAAGVEVNDAPDTTTWSYPSGAA
jgi:hypothetical protein